MAISRDTVEAIVIVFRKHCSSQQIDAIIKDLVQIKGNQSFRESISMLCDRLQR